MKDKTITEKEEIFFDYMDAINETQCNSLIDYYNDLDMNGAIEFFESIDKNGIYVHQPPFFDNIAFDQLVGLYDKYPDIVPYTFTVKGKELSNKIIMGELYFMKLKHEPKSKMSARSSIYLNLKNIPSKSTRFKMHQSLYSKTPIKVG